ncbi:MAG: flagellar biosynthetic protein FliQ [Spirochaetae bacterium HGW-Spirochaetae-7]|jgi:flagellar biosynthetic protein FliQ|nr:MAG: flagellar biosynthetic protein FliQ [Spirochaetae bacterium HGW-Spirochaetae-7]
MNIGQISGMMAGAVLEIVTLAAPILITALVVGLIVSILQATTSIQEQTLTFVPKIGAIMLVIALLGGWMFSHLAEYAKRLFDLIPSMAG